MYLRNIEDIATVLCKPRRPLRVFAQAYVNRGDCWENFEGRTYSRVLTDLYAEFALACKNMKKHYLKKQTCKNMKKHCIT